MNRVSYICGAFVACLALFNSPSWAASFQGLGDVAGGGGSLISSNPAFESQGLGVSPDGNIVVGTSVGANSPPSGNSAAAKWTSAGGMVGIGSPASTVYYSNARGVTNGDVVSGYADTSDTPAGYGQVLRWASPSGSTAPQQLPLNPDAFQIYSSFTGNHPIDGSGNLVVGYVNEAPYYNSSQASVWVNGTFHGLSYLAPGPISPAPQSDPFGGGYTDYSEAYAINTPGTYIVGGDRSGFSAYEVDSGSGDEANPKYTAQQAVMWHDATATWTTSPAAQGLGQIGGYGVGTASEAQDITNDGTKFAGQGCTTSNCNPTKSPTGQIQALFGTVGNTNLTALGVLPTNSGTVTPSSQAQAIAGNKTTVVGWSTTDVAVLDNNSHPIGVTAHTAFIWDPILTGGVMMNLKTYLTNSQGLGAALTGWTLKEANGISDDGTVIVGTGIDPSGNYEAFRAVLGLSSGVLGDYNNNFVVDAADYTVYQDHFGGTYQLSNEGAGQSPGSVTIADFNYWKSRFGATTGSGFGGSVVPEPSTGWLAAISVGVLLFGRLLLQLRPRFSAIG